jgi:hypothetical protein
VGYQAAYSTTTAGNNTAIGNIALLLNTTGNTNTAVGDSALRSNTTASSNTAVGYQAGYSNTTGAGNIALGYGSLFNNTTASNNTAVGYQAGYSQVGTGGRIQALGYQAFYSNTTGAGTAMGYQALYSNTTGTNNVAIGDYQPLFANTTGVDNVAIGSSALQTATGSGNTAIGTASGYLVTTGSKNVIIGNYSGSAAPISATGSNYVVLSDGDGNVRGYYDSNGNLIVPVAAKGVNFTANTPAAGMTSQLLNWYEEGTFTPVLAFSTSGSVTYSNQEGRYTRVGRQVTINIWIRGASISSPLGNVTLSGLPFTSSATAARVAVAIFPGLMTIVGTAYAVNYPSSNTLTLLVNNNGSGSDLQGTSLTNANFEIYCSMSYFV